MMHDKEFLVIDGSMGEGGGAILRLSAAFSILYNQPIRIINIRSKRPKPGLRLQHLLGLRSLAELTGSKLSNCDVGSTDLTFNPNNDIKTSIQVNISTAASIGLLIQPIQIACLGIKDHGKVEIKFNGGGTFGKWAPSMNYLMHVTYPIFKQVGLKVEVDINKHGWYPKGGAIGKITIYPPKEKLNPIKMTELGKIEEIHGEIIISNHLKRERDDIARRIKRATENYLKDFSNFTTNIREIWVNSSSPGVGLSLWAQSNNGNIISSGTILGEKRISSEKLGEMAANEILNYIKKDIPIDRYLSDQVIPLMAYIRESSIIRVLDITSHAKTNIQVIKKFTNRDYKIIKNKDDTCYIQYN
ncbi:MAG: RNA 3'-terminal phosphate cyclase [Promethearchaeota archaeon]